MGGSESSNEHGHSLDPYDWNQISRNADTRILANRVNPLQVVQQHPVTLTDEKQLNLAEELQQFRINDPELVSANHLNIQKSDQMCSKSYAGNLYTEYIPIRLSNIMHVPFPDNLHLYNQAFNGFHRLSKRLGPFKVNQQCVGINDNHVAKVWHSPNFADIEPQYRAESEQDMVRNIVNMIQANTDNFSMPQQEPSFAQFLYRDNDRVGFGEAKKKLELFANYFNQGVIPRYLSCVEKAGGARMIRSKWDQTNRTGNFNYGSQGPVIGQNSFGSQGSIGQNSYGPQHGSTIEQTVVPGLASTVMSGPMLTSSRVNASSGRMETSIPVREVAVSSLQPQFYQSQTFAPRFQQRVEQRVVSPQPLAVSHPQYVSSRVTELRSAPVPPATVHIPVTANYIVEKPVSVMASRTVVAPQKTVVVQQPRVVVSSPKQVQIRTTTNNVVVSNPPVPVPATRPAINSINIPVTRSRVNLVQSPYNVTVHEQPIRQVRTVQNAVSEKVLVTPTINTPKIVVDKVSTQEQQKLSAPSNVTLNPAIIQKRTEPNITQQKGGQVINISVNQQQPQPQQPSQQNIPKPSSRQNITVPATNSQKNILQPQPQPQPQVGTAQTRIGAITSTLVGQTASKATGQQLTNAVVNQAGTAVVQGQIFNQAVNNQNQNQPQKLIKVQTTAISSSKQIGAGQVQAQVQQGQQVSSGQVVQQSQQQPQQQQGGQFTKNELFNFTMNQYTPSPNNAVVLASNQAPVQQQQNNNQTSQKSQKQIQQNQSSQQNIQSSVPQPQIQNLPPPQNVFGHSELFNFTMNQYTPSPNNALVLSQNQIVPVEQPQRTTQPQQQSQQQVQQQQQQLNIQAGTTNQIANGPTFSQNDLFNFTMHQYTPSPNNALVLVQNQVVPAQNQVQVQGSSSNQVAVGGGSTVAQVSANNAIASANVNATVNNQQSRGIKRAISDPTQAFHQFNVEIQNKYNNNQPQQAQVQQGQLQAQKSQSIQQTQQNSESSNTNNNFGEPWMAQMIGKQFDSSQQATITATNTKTAQNSSPSWITQTLQEQYRQNYQSPSSVATKEVINKNSSSASQQKQQQYYFDYTTMTRQPIKNQVKQLDLNQANSASSRYREQGEEYAGYSPEKGGQRGSGGLDLRIALKSPVNEVAPINQSISEIQGKASKVLEERNFEEPRQESINTSTRNFYNNLGQDSSTYSQAYQWQAPTDYSSYRTTNVVTNTNNQEEDVYKTYVSRKNEYNYESSYGVGGTYGKETAEFARQDGGKLTTGSSAGKGEGSAGKAAYSFGGADDDRYNFFSSYANSHLVGEQAGSKQATSGGYSGSKNNYESSSSANNYKSSSNTYNNPTGQYTPSYSFQSKKQYREYNNGQLTSGYKVNQKEDSRQGYTKLSENLVTGEKKQIGGARLTDGLDLKYSMVEDDPYNVQWDPEILADLQANVHRN